MVFRLKRLIKVNYKPSKREVLKDTFQKSFEFHNYWVEKNAYMDIYKYKYIYAHGHKHTQTYPYTHRLTRIYCK